MLLFLACQSSTPNAVSDSDSVSDHMLFEFAIIADAHVYDPAGENAARLQAAVDWLNQEAPAFVLILGDIGWDDGLVPARDILQGLTPLWVPINGDNEIQNGDDDENYEIAYATQYEHLSTELEGWHRATLPVDDPESMQKIWLHNLAFDYQGLHFVGLDWASRVMDPLRGELGSLHDFPGGTLPWLAQELKSGPTEGTILFSHIPMHQVGFLVTDNDQLQTMIAPFGNQVWANYAGHYHADTQESEVGGYELIVTDATWDDAVEVRMVTVYGHENGFRYEDRLEVVDF